MAPARSSSDGAGHVVRFFFMKNRATEASNHRFAIYAWCALAYSVLVILWGTVVRATGSGAGCGDHWPLCGGAVFPHAAQISTVIEYAHRATSGIVVAVVIGLVYFGFRQFPRGHRVRVFAVAALCFTLTEGLLGAALVLYGQIGNGASPSLVFLLSIHLVNTFLLLASLALTAQSAGTGGVPGGEQTAVQVSRPATPLYVAYVAGLLGILAIAITGTIAALADSLFHATSLAQGFRWDVSGASPLLRLRMIHPAVAVIIGTFVLMLAVHPLITAASPRAKRAAGCLLVLVLLQFCLGGLNVLLLSPLWIQVLHLLAADLIWIALVLLANTLLLAPSPVSLAHAREPGSPVPSPSLVGPS